MLDAIHSRRSSRFAVAFAALVALAAAAQPAAAEHSSELVASSDQRAWRAAERGSARVAAAVARVEPRPLRSHAERTEHVARLRALYATTPDKWPAPTLDPGVAHHELGTPGPVAHPKKNPATAAKVELGRLLFFDPRLSGSGQLACASCHDPDLGWADGRTASFGHNRHLLARNAPSILNGGRRATLFWDGRAASLEEQAHMVMTNADEMHSGDTVVVENLTEIPQYVERFRAVFGIERPAMSEVAMALAAFERTVVGASTRFDSFIRGRQAALTDDALAGLHLFRTDARCMNCHNGPLLTDDKFHNLGLSLYGRRFEDLGRYNHTKQPEDVGKFRTPSLRDVTQTAPYMHNGLFDLDELLRLYGAGMPRERRRRDQLDDPLFPQKSPLVQPLGLNEQDRADLKAFLGSLSQPRRRIAPPELPPGL
ncbi:MAG: cytochrome-c peroxidase [Lacipirellulaceae bacterium]